MFFGLFNKKSKSAPPEEYLENSLGKFLKYPYGTGHTRYESEISWPDNTNSVEANVICKNDDSQNTDDNFKYLQKIIDNSASLDEELKSYITENQCEDDGLVYIWGGVEDDGEPDPISCDEFRSRLHLSYIRIYEDATSEFVFPADGLYTDHDLVVRAENDLTFTECVLEG